jgi:hypothetical protein
MDLLANVAKTTGALALINMAATAHAEGSDSVASPCESGLSATIFLGPTTSSAPDGSAIRLANSNRTNLRPARLE